MKSMKAVCRERSAAPVRAFSLIALITAALYMVCNVLCIAAWVQHGEGFKSTFYANWFYVTDALSMILLACGVRGLLKNGKSGFVPASLLLTLAEYVISLIRSIVRTMGTASFDALFVGYRVFGVVILCLLFLYTQNKFSRDAGIVFSVLRLTSLVYFVYTFILNFSLSYGVFWLAYDSVNVAATACECVLLIMLTVAFDRKTD